MNTATLIVAVCVHVSTFCAHVPVPSVFVTQPFVPERAVGHATIDEHTPKPDGREDEYIKPWAIGEQFDLEPEHDPVVV